MAVNCDAVIRAGVLFPTARSKVQSMRIKLVLVDFEMMMSHPGLIIKRALHERKRASEQASP